MRWQISHRFDSRAAVIADRHYNRRAVGTPQFVPPGRCLVLVIAGVAFWVSSWQLPEFVKHAWPGAWVCSAFRNESPSTHLSSELIVEAIAATRWFWPDVHEMGMVTFVNPNKTRRKRDPGRCFRRAGFVPATPRTTRGGLVALQLTPSAMPAALPPLGAQRLLTEVA